MRGQHQTDDVVLYVRSQDHFADQLLPFQDLVAIHHLFRLDRDPPRRTLDDRRQFFTAGVADQQFEEEPVQLGFGQRIGAFLFDRILRRHDEERFFQLVAGAGRRDGALLHRLQQGRLRLGRGAVDFIRQADLGKDRPALKLERPFAIRGLQHHVRAQDVSGHQVRRELDPREMQIQRQGQRPDQERLAQARHAFQQAMPADEQARQHAVYDLVVADDHPADLLAHRRVPPPEFLRPLLHRLADTHAFSLSFQAFFFASSRRSVYDFSCSAAGRCPG